MKFLVEGGKILKVKVSTLKIDDTYGDEVYALTGEVWDKDAGKYETKTLAVYSEMYDLKEEMERIKKFKKSVKNYGLKGKVVYPLPKSDLHPFDLQQGSPVRKPLMELPMVINIVGKPGNRLKKA